LENPLLRNCGVNTDCVPGSFFCKELWGGIFKRILAGFLVKKNLVRIKKCFSGKLLEAIY